MLARRASLGVLVTTAVIAAFIGVSAAHAAPRIVDVACGSDLDAKVNADPSGTATHFRLDSCEYLVNTTLKPREGDGILGVEGGVAARPVHGAYPTNLTSRLTCVSGLDVAIKPPNGAHFTARWLDISGCQFNGSSGSGVALAMGSAADDSLIEFSRFHHNEGVGVSNARGVYNYVEADHNGSSGSVGFIAGGIKANNFTEIKNSWLHDNIGNGGWCDNGCEANSMHPNGFWVHNVEASNNSGGGIRYEDAPTKALIEQVHAYGNSIEQNRAGIDIRDGQNAVVRNSVAGGNGFSHNGNNVFGRASDSGKADRTDLKNITFADNTLHGEVIKGCGGVVTCTGNR
jgi:hypothetical protein